MQRGMVLRDFNDGPSFRIHRCSSLCSQHGADSHVNGHIAQPRHIDTDLGQSALAST